MDVFKTLQVDDFKATSTICSPLIKSGLSRFFKYFCIYPNKTFKCLSNDVNWINLFFADELYLHSSFLNRDLKNSPRLLFSDNLNASKTIVESAISFGISKTMMLLRPSEQCTEVFFFGTPQSSSLVFENYVNNLNFFDNFIYYFKEKAAKIIDSSKKLKLFTPNSTTPDPNYIDPLPELEVNKYHLPAEFGGKYISKRELECIYWLAQGKSMEEAACILGLSKRTVEQHFVNVKKKLNCTKQTRIVYILSKLGII